MEEYVPGQIPRFLHSLGVDTVLAYGVGMRARMFFEQLGIKVVTGAKGNFSFRFGLGEKRGVWKTQTLRSSVVR